MVDDYSSAQGRLSTHDGEGKTAQKVQRDNAGLGRFQGYCLDLEEGDICRERDIQIRG